MISRFDLTIAGSLVFAGGLAFLYHRKWSQFVWSWWTGGSSPNELSTPASRDHRERSTALTGVRWLTFGALSLFVAYTHGAEEGYLIGPWGDIVFNILFVSSCWIATAVRIRREAERSTGATSNSPLPPGSLSEN